MDIDARGNRTAGCIFRKYRHRNRARFELKDENYLNFDNPLFGSNYAPAFTDIDADSDFDLFWGSGTAKSTSGETTDPPTLRNLR